MPRWSAVCSTTLRSSIWQAMPSTPLSARLLVASASFAGTDQRGIHSCGLNVDQRALAPKGYLTGSLYNWKTPYGEMIQDVMNGPSLPHLLRGGFAEGFVRMGPFGPAANDKVRSAVDTAAAELASGKRFVFSGPLKDNKGKVLLTAGQHFAVGDPSLLAMDYLVEGVNGSLT
jgi:basic membrane protein A